MATQTRAEIKEIKKQIRELELGYKVVYADFRKWEDRDKELADIIWEECRMIEKQIWDLRNELEG